MRLTAFAALSAIPLRLVCNSSRVVAKDRRTNRVGLANTAALHRVHPAGNGGRPPVRRFRRMWREVFRLAGIEFGRNKGLTWHTIRHEFVSRTIEKTGDPIVTQKPARHKDGRTTQRISTRETPICSSGGEVNRP